MSSPAPATEEAKYRLVDVGLLDFDPENPRLPTDVDPSDEATVLKFLLDDAGLVDLMRSIAAQGFFVGEPILVTPEGAADGRFIVVEGNRRLAAMKLLASPSDAPVAKVAVQTVAELAAAQDLSEVPALVFPHREDIVKHLGYRHVTGVKEWDPLAKARFLESRYAMAVGSEPERLRAVARTIGSRSDYVGRLIASLRLLERWTEENGEPETELQFSLISSALAYSEIYTFLGMESSYDIAGMTVDSDALAFVMSFLLDRDERGATRLGESRNLGKFGAALANPDAAVRLRGGEELGAVAASIETPLTVGVFLERARGAISSAEAADARGATFDDIETIDFLLVRLQAIKDSLTVRLGGTPT